MGDPPIPARGEGQVEVKPAQDKVQPALKAKRERKKYKNLRRPAVWSLKWNQLCAQMLVRPKSSPGRRAIWVVRKLILKIRKHHHIINSSSLASPSSSPGLRAVPQEVQGKR